MQFTDINIVPEPAGLGLCLIGGSSRGDMLDGRQPPVRATRTSAFTLVELLVVIAIIAILSALTVGGIRGVMASAQRMACASNLRQVGTTIILYTGDHDGILPGNGGAGSVGPQYVDGVKITGAYPIMAVALAPYIPDNVWTCPDPGVKSRLLAARGALWFKPVTPFYNFTDFLNPLYGGYGNPLCRLNSYPKPTVSPILRDNGFGTPGTPLYWPHSAKINWLYLDNHVEVWNLSPLDPPSPR
jgi:prepilin-type N-terminal cleavage/methylation domain-containing protein/prepilin-type processing-associated H-X9-DG protein